MGIKSIETIRHIKLFFRDLCNVQAFVETGTYKADTALWASSNFDQVYTIELSPHLHKQVSSKYQNYTNIIFLNGNSAEILPKIIAEINQPSIFWLDGHWSGGDTAGEENECPLLQEIEEINHFDYEKFIFIDDARLFLSPPPPPHNTNRWPTIAEILKEIEQDGSDSYTLVYNDVIISVPSKYKNPFVRFLQNLNELQEVEDKSKEFKINKPDTIDIRSEKIKCLIHDQNVLGCLKNEGLWDGHSPLRLHLGCGESRLEGYVNVDFPPTEHTIQKKSAADIYADITKISLPDQCVDEIRLHHVFEHFERIQAIALLVQWHRWLKIGAKLHIETPDIIGCAEALVSSRPYADKQAILRHEFGSQEAQWASHLDGWYAEKFQHILSRFGFKTQCQRKRRPAWPYLTDVEAIAVKENHREESELLNDAAEILKDSLVSDAPSELRMHQVWCDQLRYRMNKFDLQPKPAGSKHQAKTQVSDSSEILRRDISDLIVVDDCPAADHLGYDDDCMMENGELDFVSRIIKPTDVVFDVGANKGAWCEIVLGINPAATIFAFETIPRAFESLKAGLNYPNVELHNLAVSESDKKQTFYNYSQDHQVEEMSSFYRRSRLEKKLNISSSPISVRCVSLDSFCTKRGIPKINFLKIDTEGSELNVLQGAKAMLRSGKIDVVQFEYGGTFLDAGISLKQIYGLLTGVDCRVFRIVPKGLIFISKWRDALETYRYANYVAIAAKEVTKPAPESFNGSHPNEAVYVIFSKDRAMQLDAAISSLRLHCPDFQDFPVKVIYKASSPTHRKQYTKLQHTYPQVEFIAENDFKQDLIAVVRKYAFVVFLVDDVIFVRKFHLAKALETLKDHKNALGFSLRLGKNINYCYMFDRQQQLQEFKSISDDIINFSWVHAEFDFAYPLELSSSIYRVEEIMPLLKLLNYENPNNLESLLHESRLHFSEKMENLICSRISIAFSNPINKVQTVCATNRAGDSPHYTPEKLAALFGEGFRIDITEFAGFVPNSCHQEVALKMNKLEGAPPKVSVIVPCFNYSKYLREAVESVIGQTFQDFEIIVVNDGSTDNTKEVAETLIKEFPQYRIRLLNQENNGHPSIARNNGIAMAKGEYILPLDADDQITMTMLESCAAVLKNNTGVDFVYTDRKDFDGIDQVVHAREYDFSLLKYQNHISYCAMFRKRVWENVGGYRVTGFEDWDFWIAAGALGHQGYYLPEPLFKYRRHDTGKYQRDLQHEDCFKSQIVLNNPSVYFRKEILTAAALLKEQKFITKLVEGSPLVSVIIPTHNRPTFLEEAIQSVCSQKYQNAEIIVVNDGGEDVSEVCNKFKNECILYIEHDRNKGLAAARNTGIKAARGKYIAYLDDDDIFYPNHLETLLHLLENSEYKVAYSDAYRAHFVKENGRLILKHKDLPYSFDFDYKRILVGNFTPVLCFMHEKACLDEVGMFDENLSSHEDWDLWIRMSRKYHFKHIKKITAEFTWMTDGSTMTSGKRADMLRTMKLIYHKYADLVKVKPDIASLQKQNLKMLEKQIIPEKEEIKCSIVIPVYNQWEYTQNCLKALYRVTDIQGGFEVIVVDNASTDNTQPFLEKATPKYPGLCFIRNQSNFGFAKACNQGAHKASGKYILFLNNDTEVQPEWLNALVEVLDKDKSVAAVGSKMLFLDKKIQHAGVVIVNDQKLPDPLVARHIYYQQAENYPKANEMFTYQALTAACMLVRRYAFEAVDGFDEKYWNGYEDIDLCFKFQKQGWLLIYQPKSVVVHYESQSGPERFSRVQHNIERLHQKWLGKINPDLMIKPNGTTIETGAGCIRPYQIKTSANQQLIDSTASIKKFTSIIILTYNQIEYTKKCIESIFKNTSEPFELIVVDNGSSDGTVEYLESEVLRRNVALRIKIIKNIENKGFAGGNNQGIAAATGDYILLMNNDVVVTLGWLECLINCAERYPQIGIVGPRSNYVSGTQLVKNVNYDLNTLDGLSDFSNNIADQYDGQAQQVLRVVGFCMLIKRNVIEKIGGIDDRYGLGNFEDDDFSIRATIAGFESWIAMDCFIHHFGHRTFVGEKIDLNESLLKNWEVFKEKWGLPADLPYGSPYRLFHMKNTHFDPLIHHYPLDRRKATMEKPVIDSKTAEAVYSEIQNNISDKRSEVVIEELEKLVASYPEFALAYNDLGVLYYYAGQKEKAFKLYEKAIQLDPGNPIFQKNLADFYYVELGRVEDALRIYVKILDVNPEDVETLLITGHISVALHKFEDAKVFYQRVLDLEPLKEDAQRNYKKLVKMGSISPELKSAEEMYRQIQPLLNNGDPNKGIAALEKLLDRFPDFALAHNDLGVLHFYIGDKEKTKYHYERAVELMPENITLQKNLADFYCIELGRIEEALKIYVNILKTDPQDVETLMATGQICAALEKPGDAREFFNKVLEIEPWNEDARQRLEELESKPSSTNFNSGTPDEIYQSIKQNLSRQSQEEAIRKFESLVESHPDFALGHNDLGVLYYHSGNKENSLHHYQQAAQLQPSNITFQKNLADFLFVELKQVEEALQIYLKILAVDPRDVETLLITGHICVALKKFDDARVFYRRVLELEPDNEDGRNNLQALDKHQAGNGLLPSESANTLSALPGKAKYKDPEPDRSEAEKQAETVSIIVSLGGIQNRVKECIKSVMVHTSELHQILLINRGASKGLLKWAQQLVEDNDHYHIVECARQAGRIESLNQAIQKASGDIIVLMHNDVAVPEGWLKAFKMCINLEPNIGVVGPMSNRTAGNQQLIHSGESDRVEFESAAKAFYEQNQYRRVATRKLSDFCLAFRRELPDKIGYFDKQFVSEEVIVEDFCKRTASGGYQNLIVADTYFYHYDRHKVKKNASTKNSAGAEDPNKVKEKWNRTQNLETKAFQTVQLLARADELSQSGQIDAAVEVILGGIGVQPDDKRLYLALSEILLAAKRFQDAKDALTEMPSADDNQEMRKAELLGYAEEGLENFEAAQAHIEQVLAMNPDRAPALNLKGILAYRNDDRNSTEQFFKHAIESDPGYGEPYTNLGTLQLEADQAEDALKLFERSFILTPSDFDIATNYHAVISEQGDFKRAEVIAREAASLYPNNRKISYMLIDFLVQQGKYDEAVSEIETAIVKFGVEDGILSAALRVRDKIGPMRIENSRKHNAVSLCMIVKNEEKYLAKCLASVKPIVDEMIVVDTGSTDKTKDIAKAFGAKVFDFEWNEDFATARNFSISKVCGSWIFIMDGDEVISSIDYKKFNELVKKTPKSPVAYSIETRNYSSLANIVGWMPNDGKYAKEEAAIGWMPSVKVRLFYGKDQIWFEGSVHEMVDPVLKRTGIQVKPCSIPIHHYGRLDRKKVSCKGEIYFEIGKKKLEEMGDDINAIRELAIQATTLEKNEEAIELWQRLLSLKPIARMAAEACINMATIYNRTGKFEEALSAAKRGMEHAPELKEAMYNYALAELHVGNAEKTIAVLEELLKEVLDYPPARFILAAAYCCGGQKEKGFEGLGKLKQMPMHAVLVLSFLELAKGLISAQRIEYALLVLGAAIEIEVLNEDLLNLFTECMRIKSEMKSHDDMHAHHPENQYADVSYESLGK